MASSADRVKAFLEMADARNQAVPGRVAVADEFFAFDGGSVCDQPGVCLSDLRALQAEREALWAAVRAGDAVWLWLADLLLAREVGQRRYKALAPIRDQFKVARADLAMLEKE